MLERLRKLGLLTPNSYLFTADTDSMYTNIDTKHALEVIVIWLDSLNLPDNFPLEVVTEAMQLIMSNNIFEWGDVYVIQLLGTAMGTSAPCMWAAIYFAVHEMGITRPRHRKHLSLMLCFIDDHRRNLGGRSQRYGVERIQKRSQQLWHLDLDL